MDDIDGREHFRHMQKRNIWIKRLYLWQHKIRQGTDGVVLHDRIQKLMHIGRNQIQLFLMRCISINMGKGESHQVIAVAGRLLKLVEHLVVHKISLILTNGQGLETLTIWKQQVIGRDGNRPKTEGVIIKIILVEFGGFVIEGQLDIGRNFLQVVDNFTGIDGQTRGQKGFAFCLRRLQMKIVRTLAQIEVVSQAEYSLTIFRA